MPRRLRSLTAAGVLAGATVFGGATMAGAENDAPDTVDQQTQTQEAPAPQLDPAKMAKLQAAFEYLAEVADLDIDQLTQLVFAVLAQVDDPATDEPVAPEEPTKDAEKEAEVEEPATTVPTPAADAEGSTEKPQSHGHEVSKVARDTPPGPDHGPTVAATDQEQGEDKRSRHGHRGHHEDWDDDRKDWDDDDRVEAQEYERSHRDGRGHRGERHDGDRDGRRHHDGRKGHRGGPSAAGHHR